MTSLFALVIFFFLLVVVFPAVSLAVAAAAWVARRRAASGVAGVKDPSEAAQKLMQKTDRLKNAAFIISVVLLFFFVTPFAVLLFIQGPF